jgi:outer membrane protein assembly factor BamB
LPAAKSTPARGAKWGGSWTSFLGPNRDNVSKETGLLRSWPADGPKLVWKTQGLGQGYSNVAISDGLVISMGTPDNVESVLAIVLETGKPLWSVPTGGPVFREEHGNGPRGTPTLDGDCAYALGASGDLVCVELKSHKLRWHKNIAQEFGSQGLMYGYSESVLIDGNRLICTPGGRAATIVALDKGTGAVLWQTPIPISPQAAYASPIVCDVGVHQYITFLSRAVVGVQAQDGKPLWYNSAAANANAICTTPLLIHDFIFASAAYGAGGALVRLVPQEEGIQPQLVFHTREFQNHHGGMVAVNSFVYGADNEILTCLSLEQGRPAWKNRSVGKCSLTYADGNLYVRAEDGAMALVEATPEEYREKGRFVPPKNNNLPAWTYPVVAAGHLFLRDQDDLLCYSLRPE